VSEDRHDPLPHIALLTTSLKSAYKQPESLRVSASSRRYGSSGARWRVDRLTPAKFGTEQSVLGQRTRVVGGRRGSDSAGDSSSRRALCLMPGDLRCPHLGDDRGRLSRSPTCPPNRVPARGHRRPARRGGSLAGGRSAYHIPRGCRGSPGRSSHRPGLSAIRCSHSRQNGLARAARPDIIGLP
jgi:hypothetical protein